MHISQLAINATVLKANANIRAHVSDCHIPRSVDADSASWRPLSPLSSWWNAKAWINSRHGRVHLYQFRCSMGCYIVTGWRKQIRLVIGRAASRDQMRAIKRGWSSVSACVRKRHSRNSARLLTAVYYVKYYWVVIKGLIRVFLYLINWSSYKQVIKAILNYVIIFHKEITLTRHKPVLQLKGYRNCFY